MKPLLCLIVLLALSGLPSSSQTIIFEEEFDQYGDWYADNGVWQVGHLTKDATSPTVAATVIEGNYPRYTDSRFISGAIILPEIENENESIQLTLWQKSIYYGSDYSQVQISVREENGWGEWINVGNAVNGHASHVWFERACDLTSFAGQLIRIGFFHSENDNNAQSGGWYIDNLEIVKFVPFFNPVESFENGWEGWYSDRGEWQVGEPKSGPNNALDGTSVVGTNLAGNYQRWANSRLISPPLILPATNSKFDIYEFKFWHWFNYDGGDYGEVQISTYEDTNWSEWTSLGARFTGGSSAVWSPFNIDITRFAGKKMRIGFYHYQEDDSHVRDGWYIDNIRITPQSLIVVPPSSPPGEALYTFSASTPDENNLTLQPPNGFQLGSVSFDILNTQPENLEFTDGVGIRVNMNPNEGATFYGKPFEIEKDDYVFVRVSTWASAENVSLGIGLLDAQMAASVAESGLDGSLGLNLTMHAKPYVDRFGCLWACYEPIRNAVVPVFQVASNDTSVTVQFDNLEVIRISKYLFPSVMRNFVDLTAVNNAGKIDVETKTLDRFFRIGDRVLIK